MSVDDIAKRIQGVLPALPTPLTRSGEVDVLGLERVVEHVVRGGVHGLWILGSSGEFTVLSPRERRLVVEVVTRTTAGRVPVVVGVASNDVREVIRNSEVARDASADACFTLLPHYFTADAAEAVVFFRQVAASSPLPVVLYDNPLSTKTKLDPGCYLELAGCRNIIGLKDSSSDFPRFENILIALREKTSWRLLQGDERLTGASILWGADGAVAALASVVPRLFVRLYEAAKACDARETWSLQAKAIALGKLFELKGEPTDGAFFAGLKAGLQVLGICGGTVSSPFSAMPDARLPAVEKLLGQFQEFL